MPVDGGEAVPVLGVRGGGPVESPDGKFLYYDKGCHRHLESSNKRGHGKSSHRLDPS